jgi:hypothetical protein
LQANHKRGQGPSWTVAPEEEEEEEEEGIMYLNW